MNKKVITYLGILCVICPVFYFLSIRADGLQGGSVFVMGLMWVPAFATICTKLIHDHSIKRIGWKIRGWKQMGFAYILPQSGEPCTSIYKDVHGSPDWGGLRSYGNRAASYYGNLRLIFKYDNSHWGRNWLAWFSAH